MATRFSARRAAAAILVGAGASALSACAFWDFDGWDDRAGEAADAGSDAHADAHPDAGDGSRPLPKICRDLDARVLICQDFEGDVDPLWADLTGCIGCSAEIARPDDPAPSPSRALHLVSMSPEPFPTIATDIDFDGHFPSVTSDFWFHVDSYTSDGQPGFQDLSWQVDPLHLIRARLTLFKGKMSIGFGVVSPEDPSGYFTQPRHLDIESGWHHVNFSILTTRDGPAYTFTVDDELETDAGPELIEGGTRVEGDFTALKVRTGIFFVGSPAQTEGGTAWWLDDVVLTTP